MRFAIVNQKGIIEQISDIDGDVIKTLDEINEILLVENKKAIGCNDNIDNTYFYNNDTEQFEIYLIRKLTLLTPGPYVVGAVNLQFQQQDLEGNNVIEQTTFSVTVNGVTQDVVVEDGTLEVTINCPNPVVVSLSIEAFRYKKTRMEVTVNAS